MGAGKKNCKGSEVGKPKRTPHEKKKRSPHREKGSWLGEKAPFRGERDERLLLPHPPYGRPWFYTKLKLTSTVTTHYKWIVYSLNGLSIK